MSGETSLSITFFFCIVSYSSRVQLLMHFFLLRVRNKLTCTSFIICRFWDNKVVIFAYPGSLELLGKTKNV